MNRIIALSLGMSLATSVSATNLVENGGFEQPTVVGGAEEVVV